VSVKTVSPSVSASPRPPSARSGLRFTRSFTLPFFPFWCISRRRVSGDGQGSRWMCCTSFVRCFTRRWKTRGGWAGCATVAAAAAAAAIPSIYRIAIRFFFPSPTRRGKASRSPWRGGRPLLLLPHRMFLLRLRYRPRRPRRLPFPFPLPSCQRLPTPPKGGPTPPGPTAHPTADATSCGIRCREFDEEEEEEKRVWPLHLVLVFFIFRGGDGVWILLLLSLWVSCLSRLCRRAFQRHRGRLLHGVVCVSRAPSPFHSFHSGAFLAGESRAMGREVDGCAAPLSSAASLGDGRREVDGQGVPP